MWYNTYSTISIKQYNAVYELPVTLRFGSLTGKSEVQSQLDEAMRDIKTKTFQLEEFEKSSVRNALVEERTRFCLFISCLKPVMVRM